MPGDLTVTENSLETRAAKKKKRRSEEMPQLSKDEMDSIKGMCLEYVEERADGYFYCTWTECDARFLRRNDCKRHTEAHLPNVWFPCVCGKKLKTKDLFYKHRKEEHRIEEVEEQRDLSRRIGSLRLS